LGFPYTEIDYFGFYKKQGNEADFLIRSQTRLLDYFQIYWPAQNTIQAYLNPMILLIYLVDEWLASECGF